MLVRSGRGLGGLVFLGLLRGGALGQLGDLLRGDRDGLGRVVALLGGLGVAGRAVGLALGGLLGLLGLLRLLLAVLHVLGLLLGGGLVQLLLGGVAVGVAVLGLLGGDLLDLLLGGGGLGGLLGGLDGGLLSGGAAKEREKMVNLEYSLSLKPFSPVYPRCIKESHSFPNCIRCAQCLDRWRDYE